MTKTKHEDAKHTKTHEGRGLVLRECASILDRMANVLRTEAFMSDAEKANEIFLSDGRSENRASQPGKRAERLERTKPATARRGGLRKAKRKSHGTRRVPATRMNAA